MKIPIENNISVTIPIGMGDNEMSNDLFSAINVQNLIYTYIIYIDIGAAPILVMSTYR